MPPFLLNVGSQTTDGPEDYPMPCSESDSHGTAVAGIVAARDGNGVGSAGVAPRASLVGYNILASNLLDDQLGALTRDIDKNHVYNNSWGPDDNGQPGLPSGSWELFNATLDKGLKQGREQRGVSLRVFGRQWCAGGRLWLPGRSGEFTGHSHGLCNQRSRHSGAIQ